VTFFESIQTNFRKYADFTGRASRPEFWWWVLFTTLVSAALNALSIPFNGGRLVEIGATATSFSAYFSFSSVWGIVVLLPSLAVTVRRLRDVGREWTEIFWILLPIAGLIILIVRLAEPSVGAAPAPAPDGTARPDAAAAPAAPPPPPTTAPTAE
jgi:uncharacterized membrane protein YhaH (DUF805 family)